jgi:hypothetical protein
MAHKPRRFGLKDFFWCLVGALVFVKGFPLIMVAMGAG